MNRTTMLKFFITFFVLIIGVSTAFSQTGTIRGTVSDAMSKEDIIGAAVVIKGTTTGASTDIYGNFSIENVPAGDIELFISFISYEQQTLTVNVKPNQVTTIKVDLKEKSEMLQEVTVVAERKTNTESAVVMEVKEAKQIVSGVSRQQIARSQDKSAADAMQRIPGVTVVDNRFVMIRGLSSRYNNVMINNIIAPSTEVDKRTFSFDMISSGSLDRMMVYKSGSAENPGDFAGGVIKLYTVNAVEENFTNIKLDMGYRMQTTLQPFFKSQGSPTDFLGFDNGYRGLSSGAPSTRDFQSTFINDPIRKEFADQLPNNFNPTQSMASPDYGFGFNMGRSLTVKGKKLTTLNSVNYSNSYQTYQRDFFRYFDTDTYDGSSELPRRFEFVDNNYHNDTKINIMSNWALFLNPKSKITFSNLFNQIGRNETIIREGEDFVRAADDLRNYLLGYRSRSIYMGQLEGDHDLGDKNRSHLNWVSGFSYLGESEPDLRRFRTYRPKNSTSEEGYILQLPPSSNLFETGRYYGKLNEYTGSLGLNYTYDLNDSKAMKRQIKVGTYSDYRSRGFSARYFSYLYPGFNDPTIGEAIQRLPIDQIFTPENIRTRNGLVLEEGTRPIDSYTASNLLNAAYASVVYPISSFNISAGLRGEYNIQSIKSESDEGIIEVVNPIMSVLPFMNVGYNINEKTILRLAYGRTVNRPEFRELAPFLYYDYNLEAGRYGNSNLKTATIDNLDLRYEFYPRMGETMSIGAFYKRFTNPIEDRTIITTEQPMFSYLNADFATNYGLELEVRKSFKGLTSSSFIDKFSVNLNGAYIFSEVDLGAAAVAQDRVRPLQGQSPYIINGALYYNNNAKKLAATLIYNVFGRRIFSVGDDIFPTIYELERHSLDFTISKDLKQGINIKLGIQDILNAPFRFYQDSDRNGKIDDKDHPVFTFRRGSLFTVTATFDIHKKKE